MASFSALGPVGHPVFARLWVASFASNVGSWTQAVGAGWLITQLSDDPAIVALAQVVTALPFLIVTAGALADVHGRRHVVVAGLVLNIISNVAMAIITLAGALTVPLFLALRFSANVFSFFSMPAWQALIVEAAPPEERGSAVLLNTVNSYVARAAGPLLGGVLLSLYGAASTFLFNAGATATQIVGVWMMPSHTPTKGGLPPEPVLSAIKSGFRYTLASPDLRVLLRFTALVGVAASAPTAFLPLIAKVHFGGGSLEYATLLACYGAGALAGAVVMPGVKRRVGAGPTLGAALLSYAAMTAVLAVATEPAIVLPLLCVGGASAVTVIAQLSAAMQNRVPDWMRARGSATFQLALSGGVAIGSFFWGVLAARAGLGFALFGSAAAIVLTCTQVPRLHRSGVLADILIDLGPQSLWKRPETVLPTKADDGPVAVVIRYRVLTTQADEFARVIQDTGLMRRRMGALRWDVFRDLDDPEAWEEITVFERRADIDRLVHRMTATDEMIERRSLAFHTGTAFPSVHALMHSKPAP